MGQATVELTHHGVGVGDRVATLARNAAELVILNLACARLGALYVPLNWRLSPVELRQILADATPRILIGDRRLAEAGLTGIDLEAFAASRVRHQPVRTAPVRADRPSLILYTSGTGGRPKGAVHDEGGIAELARSNQLLGQVTEHSTFLVDAPMFHIIGLIANLRPVLMAGGSALISEGFAASRTLARLSDQSLGITHYFCVPQMATALRADPAYDPRTFRSLVALFCGGAAQPVGQLRAWLADGIPVINRYGMTEAGSVFSMPRDNAIIERKAGSVGLIVPGVACRLVDDHGRDCAAGQAGELLVQTPGLMQGYWQNPEETTRAILPGGWYRTGDVVRVDAEGFYWIEGRRSDMYVSGGENIHPAEIEAALADDPEIEECAVVGVPDDRWGEVGILFVKMADPTRFDPVRIRAALATRIARFKLPKHIHAVRLIPRNGGGKVLRRVLRPLAEEVAQRESESPAQMAQTVHADSDARCPDPILIPLEPNSLAGQRS